MWKINMNRLEPSFLHFSAWPTLMTIALTSSTSSFILTWRPVWSLLVYANWFIYRSLLCFKSKVFARSNFLFSLWEPHVLLQHAPELYFLFISNFQSWGWIKIDSSSEIEGLRYQNLVILGFSFSYVRLNAFNGW